MPIKFLVSGGGGGGRGWFFLEGGVEVPILFRKAYNPATLLTF